MKTRDEKTSVWTLPNRLSIVRILFIPVIIALITTGQESLLFAACILFIIAGITDGLDGLIARRMSMTSKLGLYLDPMADKLLVTSVLITLTYVRMVPLWVTLLLVGREFLINGLRSFYALEGFDIYPALSGKLKTTLQIVGISCLLFSATLRIPGLVIIYAALVFSVYSAAMYIRAIVSYESRES